MTDRTDGAAVDLPMIVERSAGLFARQGYMGTSMRDIGREIGIHAGSLYVHITSKEDVLNEIVRSIMQKSEQDMEAVLKMDVSATEQLRAIAARDLTLIGENKEFATVFFHEWRNLSEERQRDVIASRDRWESSLRSIITKGIEAGEFRKVDVRIAAIAFISMLNWVYVWFSIDGDMSAAEIADEFTDIIVSGLHAR